MIQEFIWFSWEYTTRPGKLLDEINSKAFYEAGDCGWFEIFKAFSKGSFKRDGYWLRNMIWAFLRVVYSVKMPEKDVSSPLGARNEEKGFIKDEFSRRKIFRALRRVE